MSAAEAEAAWNSIPATNAGLPPCVPFNLGPCGGGPNDLTCIPPAQRAGAVTIPAPASMQSQHRATFNTSRPASPFTGNPAAAAQQIALYDTYPWAAVPVTPTIKQQVAAATGTPMASSSYQPSSDDLYVFQAIGVSAPYTQPERTFAQAVESLSSPVSGYFTQQEIAAAYQAYVGNGNSVVSAQQSLQQSLTASTAALQAAGVAPSTGSGLSSTDLLYMAGFGLLIYMMAGSGSQGGRH